MLKANGSYGRNWNNGGCEPRDEAWAAEASVAAVWVGQQRQQQQWQPREHAAEAAAEAAAAQRQNQQQTLPSSLNQGIEPRESFIHRVGDR